MRRVHPTVPTRYRHFSPLVLLFFYELYVFIFVLTYPKLYRI